MSAVERPDYDGGSIVNLMESLRQGLGGSPSQHYPPLRLLPVDEVREAKHVVLLVIDGLGHAFVQRHARAALPALRGSITSVFPTATAPAITSFLTGAAPQQHAVTGWYMHLRELGVVSAVLPFRPRFGGVSIAESGGRVESFLTARPFADSVAADGCMVSPREIVESSYNRALCGSFRRLGFSDLAGCSSAVRAAIADGTRYVYAYWSALDTTSHQLGCGSRAAIDHFRRLERTITRLVKQLAGSGTLLIVTADHGFIDIEPSDVCWLGDHPELAACLAQPLCGEPRVAYLYCRRGTEERLEAYVHEHLSDRFELFSAEQLVREGVFGRGEPAPELMARIGDYAMVGRGRNVLKDRLPHDKPWRIVGMHGGRCAAEMYVPLLLWQC